MWFYSVPHIDSQVDRLVREPAEVISGDFWPQQVNPWLTGVVTCPYTELQAPEFTMVTEWVLCHLLGIIDSWQGIRIFLEGAGYPPVQRQDGRLQQAWRAWEAACMAHRSLVIRVGRHLLGEGRLSASRRGS